MMPRPRQVLGLVRALREGGCGGFPSGQGPQTPFRGGHSCGVVLAERSSLGAQACAPLTLETSALSTGPATESAPH